MFYVVSALYLSSVFFLLCCFLFAKAPGTCFFIFRRCFRFLVRTCFLLRAGVAFFIVLFMFCLFYASLQTACVDASACFLSAMNGQEGSEKDERLVVAAVTAEGGTYGGEERGGVGVHSISWMAVVV